MVIEFKKLHIENFCSIKNLDVNFYHKTLIKGRNQVGKSTIKNSIFFLLFDTLTDSSSPNGIRPHDENGIDIDFVDIKVILTIDVDGKEIELSKKQRQKWIKPHGSQEKRFDGNVNEFEINGIPKKFADFKKYIEENIAPMETLMYCTNAMAFLGLDNKKRRAKLLSLEKEFSDADVVATDKKYAPLADMLKDGTVDELIARSKKVIKSKNDELKTVPARIDELEKQKIDIDVAELELGRKALQEQIEVNKEKQKMPDRQLEEFQRLTDEALELKFELNDLERKANEENNRKRIELDDKICDLKYSIDRNIKEIDTANREIAKAEENIKCSEMELQTVRDLWTSINVMQFDKDEEVCQMCGQRLPKDKIETLMNEFDERKNKTLADITEKGNRLKFCVDTEKDRIEKLKKSLSELEQDKADNEEKLSQYEKQLSEIPQSIDISDTEECKAIQTQIAEKEAAMEHGNSANEIRQTLKAEAEDLQSQLTEIEKQIAKSENNVKLDDRIEELHAEQREISQKAADEEKTLDLLEDFNRAKVNLLTDRVNRHFELVKWQMFKPQINGGYSEVCIPTIGGTSYDGLLNNGNKILAEIDICKAFQRVNDVVCPIMADNAESVDSWRIPQTESQMLLFMRTDDKNLVIEEVN